MSKNPTVINNNNNNNKHLNQARNQGDRTLPPRNRYKKFNVFKKFNNRLLTDNLITVSTVFEVSDQLICAEADTKKPIDP